MVEKSASEAPQDRWILIRRARQLLTMRGAAGPRRGSAMGELSTILDAALLIRNGVIEDAGPSRRVENLAAAKNAREIDVKGRIVMPAFVDADAVLVFPTLPAKRAEAADATPLRQLSRKRLEHLARDAAADWTRYGALTVGAHTGYAFDLPNTVKVLRVHRACQLKPLRIRSVVAPFGESADDAVRPENLSIRMNSLTQKWLPSIRKRKLAGIVEFTLNESPEASELDATREPAAAAAALGYSIRIRSSAPLNREAREFVLVSGAVALIAPAAAPGNPGGLAMETGCVHVLPAIEAFRDNCHYAKAVRYAVEQGAPLALGSGYRVEEDATFNPQFLLHVASRRFGLSVEEALTATTYNAACSLRMSHVTGSLEPGKSADVLVMDAHDYRDLARRPGHSDVHSVLRSGHLVFQRGSLL